MDNTNEIYEELIKTHTPFVRQVLNETETGLNEMKSALKTHVKEPRYENNAFLPWAFTGGLGASQMLKKHKKDLKTCPLKCPTFREAQKVS